MKPGDVFGFPGLGYFSLRNCIIKLVSETDSSEKELSSTMILFSKELDFDEGNKNIHFFNPPKSTPRSEDEIDSQFSLSEDKALVNESNSGGDSFSSFKNNSEVENNFISKADVLLNAMEKFEGSSEDDFIIQISPDDLNENDQIDEEQSRLRRSSTIGAITTNDEKLKDTFSSLPWDFGRKFFGRKVDYPDRDKFDTQREKNDEEEELEYIDEGNVLEESVKDTLDKMPAEGGAESIEKLFDSEDGLKADSDVDEALNDEIGGIGNFERVKTYITSEIKSKTGDDESKQEDKNNENIKIQPKEKLEDNFTPVKSKTEVYNLKSRKKKKKKRKVFQYNKDSISLSETKDKYEYHKRKRRVLPFIIPFAIIIIAIGAVYLYLEKDSVLSSEPENVVIKVTPPPHVNVIERDFEFAVTFPYSKSEIDDEISGIDPSIFISEITPIEQKPKVEETKKEVIAEQKSEEKVERTPETKVSSLSKNISKYKNYYIVQVAAYNSYATAEVEAEKFRNQGYNAFIEIAELPGRGTWYRIKVGDFTSIKHAENFLIKNRN
jgi:cell division septation protein DedD